METIVWISAIVVAAFIAWAVGAARTRGRYRKALEDLAAAAEEGRRSVPDLGEGLPGMVRLRSAFRGLLERASLQGEEGAPEGPSAIDGTAVSQPDFGATGSRARSEGVVLSALDRIQGYLKGQVEQPLRDGLASGGRSAEVAARDALVALKDLYFYLRPVPEDRSPENLNEIARDAGREYESEWDVEVDVHVPERPTTVEVDRESLLDAIYLVLHNAGTFGEGKDIEVVVRYQEGDCWLVVRDRGPGFDDEALRRPFDPFYTTTESALGLGLFQVKRIVEAMGGTIAVRNRRGGGGQVEIVLPGTDS